MSVFASVPTTVASERVPSWNTMLIFSTPVDDVVIGDDQARLRDHEAGAEARHRELARSAARSSGDPDPPNGDPGRPNSPPNRSPNGPRSDTSSVFSVCTLTTPGATRFREDREARVGAVALDGRVGQRARHDREARVRLRARDRAAPRRPEREPESHGAARREPDQTRHPVLACAPCGVALF